MRNRDPFEQWGQDETVNCKSQTAVGSLMLQQMPSITTLNSHVNINGPSLPGANQQLPKAPRPTCNVHWTSVGSNSREQISSWARPPPPLPLFDKSWLPGSARPYSQEPDRLHRWLKTECSTATQRMILSCPLTVRRFPKGWRPSWRWKKSSATLMQCALMWTVQSSGKKASMSLRSSVESEMPLQRCMYICCLIHRNSSKK